MDHKAIKVIEGVCNDFDGNGIFSVGAIGALRAMSRHWKDHLAEGHNSKIISEDIDEMKNQLEVMRAEIMRRLAETLDQKPANKFELTLRGFSGGTGATDAHIIAVSTHMAEGALLEFLDYTAHPVVSISPLPDSYDAIDFRLPEDVAALRARVKAVLSA